MSPVSFSLKASASFVEASFFRSWFYQSLIFTL